MWKVVYHPKVEERLILLLPTPSEHFQQARHLEWNVIKNSTHDKIE